MSGTTKKLQLLGKLQSSVYILSEGETLADAPIDADVVIDPYSDEAVFPEGGGAQSDWNAAEGEPGHVLNRPFYSDIVNGVALPETIPTYDEGMEAHVLANPLSLIVGEKYTVNWNGVEYTTNCVEVDQGDGTLMNCIGNVGAMMGTGDTGEPFVIINCPKEVVAVTGFGAIVSSLDGATDITISITGPVETVHPLPIRYVDMVYPMTVTLDEVFSSGDSLRIEREENYNDFAELLWNGGKIRLVLEHNGAIVVAFSTKFFYDDESHLNVAFPHIGQTDVQGNHMWLVFTNGTWKPPME